MPEIVNGWVLLI